MGLPLPANDPLGTDLRLDQNGDLGATISGDLDLVTEEANVGQAIRVQMTTNKTDYLWGDDVGGTLASYVDRTITAEDEQEITDEVNQILNNDPRILQVQSVDIDDSTPGRLVVTPNALVESIGVVQTPVVIEGGNNS